MSFPAAIFSLLTHTAWITIAVMLAWLFVRSRITGKPFAVIVAIGLGLGMGATLLPGFRSSHLLRAELSTIPVILCLPFLARSIRARNLVGRSGSASLWTLLSLVLIPLLALWAARAAVYFGHAVSPDETVPYTWSALHLVRPVGFSLCLFLLIWQQRRVSRYLAFPGIVTLILTSRLLAHPELVVPLQSLVTRLVHDVSHWMDLLLLVPHHHMVGQKTWDVFAILMRWEVSLGMLYLVLTGFLFLFAVHHFRSPGPEIEENASRAERRKLRARFLQARRRQSVPFVLSMLLILIGVQEAKGQYLDIYEPDPVPVIAESERIRVPMQSAAGTLNDGRLHKFVIQRDEMRIVFILMSPRPQEMIGAVDDCVICPPRGYAQKDGDLFCLYCRTIIPSHTIGRAGGCNPVPFPVSVEGEYIYFRWDELKAAKKNAQTDDAAEEHSK